MDEVFRALADPGRRQLLDSLNARSGQTLRELCAGMRMARQSVSKHLAVLEAAGLVTTVWRGREKLHYLNPAPISDISERWIHRYDQQRVDALSDLKQALENPTMDRPSFVYTTYIQTTPERLWEALTSSAFTLRYWNAAFETDWEPGSEMVWNLFGVRVAHPEQVVLEADPPRRLSYTWHTFTPELARAAEVSEDQFAAAATEPRSRGRLRARAGGERREADRDPRRLPGAEHGGAAGHQWLAASDLATQDAARDRRDVPHREPMNIRPTQGGTP